MQNAKHTFVFVNLLNLVAARPDFFFFFQLLCNYASTTRFRDILRVEKKKEKYETRCFKHSLKGIRSYLYLCDYSNCLFAIALFRNYMLIIASIAVADFFSVF